jgi:hypothetical protein
MEFTELLSGLFIAGPDTLLTRLILKAFSRMWCRVFW